MLGAKGRLTKRWSGPAGKRLGITQRRGRRPLSVLRYVSLSLDSAEKPPIHENSG